MYDCGGPWGYAHLLEVLADPQHPDHAARLAWVGGPVDPTGFGLEGVQDALATLR